MLDLNFVLRFDDREVQLLCMGNGCSNPLSLDQADFCSDLCCESYQDPAQEVLAALPPEELESMQRDRLVRMKRVDRLRAENPDLYLVPIDWPVGVPYQSA
jgi:hypothetical protein